MKKVLGVAVICTPLWIMFAYEAVTVSFGSALRLFGYVVAVFIFASVCTIAGLMIMDGEE